LSQFNYFGPRNFGVFASYYTETLLYSNFRGPLFSRTCQAREIRKITGTPKKLMLGGGPHEANQDAVTLQNKTMTTAFPKMK